MSAEIEFDYDEKMDVLYVRCGDARIVTSCETPSDGATILNFSADRTVVGAQILEASGLSVAEWWTHPDRAEIPADLFDAVAEWLGARERAR